MKDPIVPRLIRQRGLSLVELMVAMLIGLIILAAVSTLFANSNKNYKTTDSLARLQENARTALQFITNDIRRAGYVGCMGSVDNVQVNLNGGNINGIALTPFTGTEGGGSVSDTLTLHYVDLSTSVAVTASMQSESDVVTLTAGHPFKQYDIVAVTDCDKTDVFQITNNAAGGTTLAHASGSLPAPYQGNGTATLSKAYSTDARIMKFSQLTYQIQNGANGRPSLFRAGQELVEGIENMQLLYGVRTGTTGRTPNSYRTFDNVPNWQSAVNIRVGLLAYSIADTTTGEVGREVDTQPITLNATNISAANDKRIRRTFVTTVDLRNIR